MSYDAPRTVTIENNGRSMTIAADPKISKNEIAKGIRDAIKLAVKKGILPKAKYSVRQPYYGSIDITASCLPFRILSKERVADDMAHKCAERPWMSEEARAIDALLEKIGGAWNWNRSRSEEDFYHYNYNLSVTVGGSVGLDVEREALMAEITAEARELERARLIAMVQADAANDTTASDDETFQVTFF